LLVDDLQDILPQVWEDIWALCLADNLLATISPNGICMILQKSRSVNH